MNREPATTVRKTRRSVLIIDKIADKVVTVGGILVIGAVLGMMAFLVSVVLPLFKGATVESQVAYDLKGDEAPVAVLGLDEFKTVGTRLSKDGIVQTWHAQTGTPLKTHKFDLGGKQVTAVARTLESNHVAFGFADGTVRFAKILHKIDILNIQDVPEGLKKLNERDRTDGAAVYSLIPGDQVRKIWVELEAEGNLTFFDSGNPIISLGYSFSTFGERPTKILAAIDTEGHGKLIKVESKLNLFTRKVKMQVTECELPQLPKGTPITHTLVNELADKVYFASNDGKVYRFNTRDTSAPFLAETFDVTSGKTRLNVFGYLLGQGSIVVGRSDGSLSIYFLLRQRDPDSVDGFGLVNAREFESQPSAIVAFTAGQRGKTFATSDSSGNIWVRHGTSQRTLLRLHESKSKISPDSAAILLTARRDGILTVDEKGQTILWNVDIPHPETSLGTLFGKVWYEGYEGPTYTWQSTGATDAFEPKLSLVPLIFGTLKATLYSLLFAIPLSLLAAIYTSEFLHPKVRGRIKPAMEVMASIPSVVLGFIAALVLAPVVETWIAAVVLAFVVLPLSLILASYLWQLFPPHIALRMEGVPKLGFMFGVVGVSLYCAYALGPLFESVFFGGSFKAWVNGDVGEAAPFLFLCLLPISAILTSILAQRLFGARFNKFMRESPPFTAAISDLGRWLGIAGASIGLSAGLAFLLQALGLDVRGGPVDTYVQRNTFIVGFAMGFAVIPIIYTLSEDALNAVPEHLRAASLGCGATPWQTATWIILPTALSGVFSACMIGMGRAVGETMIVVMCTGNTPLLDLNIFNGLRALSANIAVELPEAPKDDTLYRVLFLTGVVLFAMTFVINTIAEMVRLRFRKRSMQL